MQRQPSSTDNIELSVENVKNIAERSLKGKHANGDRSFSWAKMGQFMKIVLFNAKKSPWLFSIMLIVTIGNGILVTLLPLIASNMTSMLTNRGEVMHFLGMYMHWYSWVYVLIVALIAQMILEFLTDYTIGCFAVKVEIQQRLLILDKLVDQDINFFFDHPSGVILTRLVADTQGLSLGIQQFLTNVIYCLASIISAAVILFLKDARLTGIALGYTVGVLIIAGFIFFWFRRALIRMFDVKRDIDADVTDRISNITLIKSSGMEVPEIKRNEKENAIYNKAGNLQVLLSVILNLWIYIANSFLPTIMIIIMVSMLSHNELINMIVVFLPNVSMIALPMILMIQTLRAATRASNSADRIGQLTNPVPTIVANPSGAKINEIDEIDFKNITFAYPSDLSNTIIPKTNFKFEKGKSYAFVGETGSGKSTIGRLLLRLYDPTTGEVVVNNKYNLKDLDMPNYLQHVGYVEQNPQIFYGDFWENIAYGCPGNPSHDDIISAAKKANLHDFIMTLPQGYETILGERGFLLSGGQKQRLVIARIFLKDPDLIILDEATSALDNIVEKEIQAELDKLVKGKTSVTIAHRLSTIENVDEIVVLTPKVGITQIGTFDELKKAPGHFKKLYEAGLMD